MKTKFKIAIEWLKRNYKASIIIFCSVLIALFLLNNQSKLNKLRKDNQLQSVELSTLKDSVSIYKSKTGELTFKFNAIEVESSNAKKALEIAGFEKKELKNKNIKLNDVNIALNAKLEASGSGQIVLHDTTYVSKIDTVMAKVGEWSNNYLSLYPEVISDTLNFKYKYEVGIKVIGETNKTISIALTDPFATITTANGIIIKNKKQWWNKWYVYTAIGFTGGCLLLK